jgi:hypothetical protein
MKRLRLLALSLALVVAAGPMAVADPPPGPERDPQEVFRYACDCLKALDSGHTALKGLSEVKPQVEMGEKQRLASAAFVFKRNATPPGKGPARAKDATLPFVYVSVQVWAGRSQQPPPGLYEFSWKGQIYQAWVQVYGSDPALVQAIRRQVVETLSAPPPFSK